MRIRSTLALCLAIATASIGCTGSIGGDDPTDPTDPTDPIDPTDPVDPTAPRFHFEPEGADVRPGFRRLTIAQMEATFEQITGVPTDLSALPGDPELLGLGNDASRLLVRDAGYMQILLRVATNIAAESDLGARFPCSGGCDSAELRAFLERAFVHPVDDEMLGRYQAIYTDATGRFDDEFGRRAVMQAALISPYVLYRTEIGEGGSLTSFELAEKLSYYLWGTPPDDTLRAAAFDGSLLNEATFRAEADRLMADPKMQDRMRGFIYDWLGLDHFDIAILAGSEELPAGIESSMEHEVDLMIDRVLFEEGRGFRQLLLSESTFVDASLAELYGLTLPAGAEPFQEVSLAGSERQGLLTTALVLAAHAKEGGRSPMQRGKFLVDELLCYGFPPDAGEAAMTLPAGTDDLTFREKFGTLEMRADCNKCHRMINVGFAFDIFDNVGRRWSEDFVSASDATGSFDLAPFPLFMFESTRDAVAGIAAHPALGRCYSAQLYRYSQGSVPGADDAELLSQLEANFDETDGDIASALRLIVNSDRFAAAAN